VSSSTAVCITGASDFAGEFDVRLTRSGPVGYHKPGSVEGWASGGGVAQVAAKRVTAALKSNKTTFLAACLEQNGKITAKDLSLAAQQGNRLARRIIRDTGTRLGEALAILVNLLNPERVVIGGLALRLGEDLLRLARLAMGREALSVAAEKCQIVAAALGEQIDDVAAICAALVF
jgi:glucokinase